jgi:hypothetical protein
MPSLSIQSLHVGQKVGVLCSHGKVLARLIIEKNQTRTSTGTIQALVVDEKDDTEPYGVRRVTTINLLGAPWAPRIVVGAWSIASARKMSPRGVKCECTLDSPPRASA